MSDKVYPPEFYTESNAANLNIANWVLIGTSALFLVLRIWCKRMESRGLWWDDHVLIASWLALAMNGTFGSLNTAHGFGTHRALLTDDQLRATTLYTKIASTFSITASSWSKTSFALTMLRITEGRRLMTVFLWFALVSINLTKAGSAMVAWIMCRPLRKAWDPFVVGGTCWARGATADYNMFSAIYSGVMDLVLAVLPWQIIMTLQMRTREKIGVAFAMSMGIFAGITAFIKCAKIPLLTGDDYSYTGWELIAWGSAETAMTIIAASVPVLRVLLRRYYSTARRERNHGSYVVHSSSHYMDGGSRQTGARGTTAMHGAVITISGGRVGQGAGRDPLGVEECGESQQSFEMTMNPGTKIVQTNEIRVDFQDRKDDSSIDGDRKVAETGWPR